MQHLCPYASHCEHCGSNYLSANKHSWFLMDKELELRVEGLAFPEARKQFQESKLNNYKESYPSFLQHPVIVDIT